MISARPHQSQGHEFVVLVYEQDPGSLDFGMIENEWNASNTLFESSESVPSQLLPDWDLDEALYASLFELPQLPENLADVSSSSQTPKDQQHAETVKDLWFTRSPATTVTTAPESHSGITSGVASPQPISSELNDHQRSRLQKRLEIRSFESPVPPTEFLNTCIRLYFSRAHAVFPVVHPATFHPSKARSAVTLAICVMGTLYMGSEQALAVGVRLFERLQKATLLYWEKAKMDDPTELTAIIQGAVLAQVFSHLSGIPNLLMAADSFHGPPVSWARHQNLFGVRHSVRITADSTEEELQQAWREWARNEEYIRTSHALSIVDAELATLLHHEPIMRLNCRKLTPTSSDKLFMASKASDWRAHWFSERHNWPVYRGEGLAAPSVMSLDILRIPQTSMFTAYAVLQELRMRVLAIKADKYQTAALLEPVHTQLRTFACRFLTALSHKELDSLALRILWHSAFISVYADLDLLEKRIGREGASFTKEESAQVSDWADSDDAKAAVAHALLVKRLVESMTVLHEPAIHVPRSLFSAGVTLFCYGKFASSQQKAKLSVLKEALPEIKLLNENMILLLREGCDSASGVLMFERSLYVIVELLRRVGSWGLSHSFATILGTMTTQESGHS